MRRSRTKVVVLAFCLAGCGGGVTGGSNGAELDGSPSGDATGSDARPTDARPVSVASWAASDGILPSTACPPWTLVDEAEPEVPTLVAEALTIATSDDAEMAYYEQRGAVLAPRPRWTIEATLFILSSSASIDNRTAAGIGVSLAGVNRGASLFVGDGVVFLGGDGGSGGVRGPSIDVPTDEVPHTIQLEIDSAALRASVRLDGAPVLEGPLLPNDGAPFVEDRMTWGDFSSFARGTTRWVSISHDGHVPADCP